MNLDVVILLRFETHAWLKLEITLVTDQNYVFKSLNYISTNGITYHPLSSFLLFQSHYLALQPEYLCITFEANSNSLELAILCIHPSSIYSKPASALWQWNSKDGMQVQSNLSKSACVSDINSNFNGIKYYSTFQNKWISLRYRELHLSPPVTGQFQL